MLDKYNYTNTYTQYVILITFPRRQWFRERTLMLRYSSNPIAALELEGGGL